MAFYSEYPHTRNYDDDQRELIALYNQMVKQYEDLQNVYDDVNANVKEITETQLNKWLTDGTLANTIAQLGDIVRVYDTTVSLQSAESLVEGSYYITGGYASLYDGYGAIWKVESTPRANAIQLAAGSLYLTMVIGRSFDLGQIGHTITDLDVLLPALIENGRVLNLTNAILTRTYDTTYYTADDIVLNFTGSTISAKTPYNATAGALLSIRNSKRVHIIGGTFNGKVSENAASTNREQCHVLNILNCDSVIIEECDLGYVSGDGIQIGTNESIYEEGNAIISNCHIHHVSRNGISVLSGKNTIIEGCNFDNITADPYNNTMPLGIIDVEPFINTQNVGYIEIRNCTGSSAGGIIFYNGADGGTLVVENTRTSAFTATGDLNAATKAYINLRGLILTHTMRLNQANSLADIDVLFDNFNQALTNFTVQNIAFCQGSVRFNDANNAAGGFRVLVDSTNTGEVNLETNTPVIRTIGGTCNVRNNLTNPAQIVAVGNYGGSVYALQVRNSSSAVINPINQDSQPVIVMFPQACTITDSSGGQVVSSDSFPLSMAAGDMLLITYSGMKQYVKKL